MINASILAAQLHQRDTQSDVLPRAPAVRSYREWRYDWSCPGCGCAWETSAGYVPSCPQCGAPKQAQTARRFVETAADGTESVLHHVATSTPMPR